MKGVYLGAYKAYLPGFDLDYCDIVKSSPHINLLKDMLTVDLTDYDFVIATPPCNYYSKCNYRRDISDYALSTRHLLPCIITKLATCFNDKPFIIENVRNFRVMGYMRIYDLCNLFNLNIYEYGRHTYITNIFIDFHNIPQRFDFRNHGVVINYGDSTNEQGGFNVDNVLKHWLAVIHYDEKRKEK